MKGIQRGIRGVVLLLGLGTSAIAGAFLLGAYAVGFEVPDDFRSRGADGYSFSWEGALIIALVLGLLAAACGLSVTGDAGRRAYAGASVVVACLGALAALDGGGGLSGWAMLAGALLLGVALFRLGVRRPRLAGGVTAVVAVATVVIVLAASGRGRGGERAGPAEPIPTSAAIAPPSGAATAIAPASSPESTPMRVSIPPGQVFEATRGVYYVDLRSGAIEGWELPVPQGRAGAVGAPFPTSSTGRYLVYSLGDGSGGRVYDTRTGVSHDVPLISLPPYTYPRFSPDDRRYYVADERGVTIRRLPDGAVERTIDASALGDARNPAGLGAWSPDGQSILLSLTVPAGQVPLQRVLLISVASGDVRQVGEGLFAEGVWSKDGRRYYVATFNAVEARDAADDRLVWRLTDRDLRLPIELKAGVEPLGRLTVPFLAPNGTDAVVLATARRGSDQASARRVYVIEVERGRVRFWLENALSCGRRWTADGRWLHVVGGRGGESGSFLVAADGSEMRFVGSVTDVSPVDPALGGRHGYEPGGSTLYAVDLRGGESRAVVRVTGAPGWDTAHDPLWLVDGRIVLFAPHYGHEGCGFHQRPGDLEVRFP